MVPTVTLTGRETTGGTATANVSSNEAVFVNGMFADDEMLSDTARAQIAVNDIKDGLANQTVAFILPGVNLLIFPVGLVITVFWTIVGLAAYGFGTYERIGYRDAYRRSKARSGKAAPKTF